MADDSLVGKRLGAYRIEQRLASGAMGDVYKGVHEALRRPVAIKTLKDQVASERSLLERFFAEARAVNVIRHENIVEVTDLVSEQDGRSYMVMELLEGRTLGGAIREAGKMEPERAVRIAAQIADAIGAAHEKDIVHRDLKPDNVFLIRRAGSDDYVKILDFGIARLRPDIGGMDATQTGALIGTPSYMSPEQVAGERVGPAADIYALGVILFHMLAGRPPFEASAAVQVMMAHLQEPAPSVAEVAAGTPAALAALVDQMLRKNPDERPRSMFELREALLRAVGLEVAAARTTEVQQATGATMLQGGAGLSTVPPTWTGKSTWDDETRPTSASDTVERGGLRTWWFAGAAVAVIGAGALIGALVLPGGGGAPGDAVAGRVDQDARAKLDRALASAGEPLAPEPCRETDLVRLTLMAGAAEQLVGGAPGSAREQDRAALARLQELPPQESPEHWYLLARAQLHVGGQEAEALASAERALKLCVGFTSAHAAAGTALFRMDKPSAARRHFATALAKEPTYMRAMFNQGLVHVAEGRMDAALLAFDKVIAADPSYPDVYLARGQAYLMDQQAELAIDDFHKAAELEPDNADAHYALGLAHKLAGHADEAKAAHCKAKDLGHAKARCE